jgi:hypothetical protein
VKARHFFVFSLLATGCANTEQASSDPSSAGGSGGSSPGSCGAGQKLCEDSCVSTDDPAYGCSDDECAAACDVPNATASCESEACIIATCENGWADCDGADFNGCEIYIAGDLDNCGACEARCTASAGEASCVDGQCTITCQPDHGDCDGDPSNGCEVDLRTNAHDCGQCGHECGGGLACGSQGVPGVCEPELLAKDSFTNGASFTRAIAIDDTFAYYTSAFGVTSPPKYEVLQVEKEPAFVVGPGGVIATVPKPLARLLVDDTYCYGLEDGSNGGNVIRFDKTGASSTVTTLDGSGTALEIALHGADIYFLSNSGGVVRIAANGSKYVIATAPAPGTQRGLAISGDQVFFPSSTSGAAQLMSAPVLGGSPAVLPVTFSTAPLTGEPSILAIAASPSSVFFFDQLSLGAFDAPNTMVLASDFYLSPRSIFVSGSHLYYSRWSGFSPETSGAIFQLETGSPGTPKLLRGGLTFAPAIAVDDAYVYSHEGDHIYRVTK